MTCSVLLFFSIWSSFISAQSSSGWSESQPCTFHDYEGDVQRMGLKAADDAPGFCGIRYSALNLARITAISSMNPTLCGQCVELRGSGESSSLGKGTVFVLAMDLKGKPGLDVTKSSFSMLFPTSNPLDPQMCQWRVVPMSNCGKICYGSESECTPGTRNLLPANLLPPLSGTTPQGIDIGSSPSSGLNGTSGNNVNTSSTRTNANSTLPNTSPLSNVSVIITASAPPTTGSFTTAEQQKVQSRSSKNHAEHSMSPTFISFLVFLSFCSAIQLI